MIGSTRAVRVYVYTGTVDMRKGYNWLQAPLRLAKSKPLFSQLRARPASPRSQISGISPTGAGS